MATARTAPRQARTAALEMVLCTLLWGGFFVVGKMASREAGPMAIATLRFFVASGLLVALVAWREPGALRLRRGDVWLLVALGASGVAGYNVLAFLGFAHAPASDGAMISPTLNPALTAVLAAPLLGERLTRARVAGLALAVGGVTVVTVSAARAGAPVAGEERWLGDLFFVLSAVAWSAYTLLGKVAARRFTPLASTTYASLAGFVLLLPFSVGELAHLSQGHFTARFLAEILFLAVFATIAAYLLWYDAIRRVGAAASASYLPLVPVFGVLLGAVFLGDRPGGVPLLGSAVAVLGVWWANRGPRLEYKLRFGPTGPRG